MELSQRESDQDDILRIPSGILKMKFIFSAIGSDKRNETRSSDWQDAGFGMNSFPADHAKTSDLL